MMSDTVNNTNEIVKLVKFSPKRENLLGQIKSNIEMEDEEESISASGLTKFCALNKVDCESSLFPKSHRQL